MTPSIIAWFFWSAEWLLLTDFMTVFRRILQVKAHQTKHRQQQRRDWLAASDNRGIGGFQPIQEPHPQQWANPSSAPFSKLYLLNRHLPRKQKNTDRVELRVQPTWYKGEKNSWIKRKGGNVPIWILWDFAGLFLGMERQRPQRQCQIFWKDQYLRLQFQIMFLIKPPKK